MISDVFFPRVNGVSTSIATFRRGLCENGQHRCTLVVPHYGADDPPDPDVHRVPARRVPMDPEDRLMRAGALDRALGGIDVHLARRRRCRAGLKGFWLLIESRAPLCPAH